MKNFYEKLYTSESTTSSQCIQSFLEKFSLPSLSEADKSALGRPITSEEIKNAIKSLQNGKAPGPDGYGQSFIKISKLHRWTPAQDVPSFNRERLPTMLFVCCQYIFNP